MYAERLQCQFLIFLFVIFKKVNVIGGKGSRPTDISETKNAHVPLNKTEVLTAISPNSLEVTPQSSSQKGIVQKIYHSMMDKDDTRLKHRNDRMFVITAVVFICVFLIVTFTLIKKTRKPCIRNLSEDELDIQE